MLTTTDTYKKMAENSNSSRKDALRTPNKERIVPIKIEADELKVVSATTPNTRSSAQTRNRREERNVSKQPLAIDMKVISDDSNSADESNVRAGVQALSLTPVKQENTVAENLSVDPVTDGPQQTLPNYNVPERIIIIFDRAHDENSTSFELVSGKKFTPLFMLQHALLIFLQNKAAIDSRHEFALVLLNENSATWVHDFTNSPQDIIASVQAITEFPCEPEDIFDLNTVFDLISKHIYLSVPSKDPSVPPPFVVRTVLLYGRSYSIPQLTRTEQIEKLISSPYFTVDVVMTHEPPDSANHCEKIFKELQEIDTKGISYSFSVSRSASDLHCAMAKILSHPLQRPHQLSAKYDISSFK